MADKVKPVSVLFCAKNSVYKTLGVDCWDEERNALNWPGGNPGIFHPPCRLFCMLRHFSTAPIIEKELAYWSVEQVRKWGGVLEHPAHSKLWRDMSLPEPGSLFNDPFGLTVQIDQFRFGHPSRKKTWLYICGSDRLPMHPGPKAGKITPVFTGHGRKATAKQREFRSNTPINFARWLIELAEGCNV